MADGRLPDRSRDRPFSAKDTGPRRVRFRDEDRQGDQPANEIDASALEDALFGEKDPAPGKTDDDITEMRRQWRERSQASASQQGPASKSLEAASSVTKASEHVASHASAGEPQEPPAGLGDEDEDEGEDSDGFDLFAEHVDESQPQSVTSTPSAVAAQPAAATTAASDKVAAEVADDAEGYMTLRAGDSLGSPARYVVQSTSGKGVFSTVVLCEDVSGPTASTSDKEAAAGGSISAIPGAAGSTVAIKVVRANETMHKAAMQEAGILLSLSAADKLDRRHIIRLRGYFEWKGHVCLVFEPMALNLRELIDRFGKRQGLSSTAVRTFGKQLLSALDLMGRMGVVHADIKPQNIVVNAALTSCKLCDFGSAFRENSPDNVATPMLVSRYYRAPEVILGLQHTTSLDLWSIGCVLYELYTGQLLFSGRDNDEMLWQMMQLRGPVHNKLVKQHLRQCAELGLQPLFDDSCRFIRKVADPVTREMVSQHVLVTKASRDMAAALVPPSLHGSERRAALQLKDLLEKILTVDRKKRITPHDALQHPFFASVTDELGAASSESAASAAAASSAAESKPEPAAAPARSSGQARKLVPVAASRSGHAWRAPSAWKR